MIVNTSFVVVFLLLLGDSRQTDRDRHNTTMAAVDVRGSVEYREYYYSREDWYSYNISGTHKTLGIRGMDLSSLRSLLVVMAAGISAFALVQVPSCQGGLG